MKYIKLFEEYYPYIPNRYWKVRADEPYFRISLDKLGVPKTRFGKLRTNDEYVIILATRMHNDTWEWEKIEHLDVYKRQPEKFGTYMGELEITPEDIEEWEIKQNVKKYNL